MNQDEFRALCEQHLGKCYIWGANGPGTFDCSGLVQWMLATIQLDPAGDQTANGLYRHFKRPKQSSNVAPSAAELGDLVFYGTPRRLGHIAIAWGEGRIFEAGGGGSETTSIEIAQQQNASVRIADMDRRPDLVAVLRPAALPW
jgi:cell wall-associated NlpC family hydrolase